ncbi:hypothetical protein GCM10012275_22500 [Longimycelium tulufanense]|uniref:Glucose/Sorbosone dehydrogenase domain-containing protein n=2 Tax=Longimycelium tulufanense TaxID=907463 RepID=A0A8J3CAJ8_9PSEU|nr:hypothetical protein GCM10012275_22500 [Longimycelium tulufanense]
MALVAGSAGMGAVPAATAAPPLPPGAGERTVAGNLTVPWGLAFLPDGSALVTERDSGKVLQVTQGRSTVVAHIAEAVKYGMHGGLLGIAVSPNYAQDGWVYVFYTTEEDNRIARFRLGEAVEPIVTGIARGEKRNGGALAFGPDGMLYAGVGDAGSPHTAQDLGSLNGKILRMTANGAPAPDNPYPGSLVYSLGHRDVQGMAWDEAGVMYAGDIGEDDWDEINVIEAGGNYGWPTCEGQCSDDSVIPPMATLRPEEGVPTGVAYRNGALYVSTLRGQRLVRIEVHRGTAEGPARTVPTGRSLGRLRAAVNAPDGSLWVTTSNRDGKKTPGAEDDRVVSLMVP